MHQGPHHDALAVNVPPSPTSPPEPGQLGRIRAGDEKAFEELFKTYYRALCTFTDGYVRSRETAEELVQTIWLKGEEDPDPAKAEQYARWRELRQLHERQASRDTTLIRRPA